MAFLRSQKFFRFLSVGKNIINFREYDVGQQIPAATTCVCSTQNFATISAIKTNQNLESQLKKLDQDVRRSGRISRRDLEEILEEIRSNKSPTSSQSLLVIRCCGNLVPEEKPETRTKIVQEIWKTLSSLKVPMDISHYNALLRVYLENEYDFSPIEFLAELQAKGVEPNRVTYQRLIARYCQQGDIDGATQILEFMREKQLPVNENVFNALIMGHSNADDIESATGILGVMAQAGLEPSADTYTTLLCGFAKVGDIDSINKYIELCEQKEIHLLDKDFLEVVYSLATNGHEDKINGILDRTRKSTGYNQDAVNVILRLVNKGKVETALSILRTMQRNPRMDGELVDTGSFLIKQLVKAERSIEQVLSVCAELENSQMHTKPILIATEEAFREGKVELGKKLLTELKKKDIEVRQHYFWPLIAASKTEKEALDVINFMISEFNQEPSGQTLREYVIPKITNQNYDHLVLSLRRIGVSQGTAAACVAYTAIKKDDLAGTAKIMNSYDSYYSPGLLRKPLLYALTATRDFDNYVKVVRGIYDGVPRLSNINAHRDLEEQENANEEDVATSENSESKVEKLQSEIVGSFVLDFLINVRKDKFEGTQKILEGLVAQGLSISNEKAELIQNRIGEQMTTELSTLLGKLASGELEPIEIERQVKNKNTSYNTNVLERLITRLDEKGENTKGMKKQLLIQSIRAKDLEKTEQLIEKLKAEGYKLTNGVYALLLELYAIHDKVDEALKIYQQIKTEEPDFKLDDIKALRLVQALVNNDRLDEALKYLEANKRENIPDNDNFPFNMACWRSLNYLAEKGKVSEINTLYNSFVENNFATSNNILLGTLIKVHLVNNEVKEALDKFEELCLKHRATPWKSELARMLIQTEDATNLQRITDLSSDVHGEVNSLYDLVFSFIECGRIRQARKILETPGLRTRTYNRFSHVCERYVEEGKPLILEGLVEATKDLNHIDRSEIYYSLMQTYIKENSVEKCLELWTKMQEEDITASDIFLLKLAEFLKSQGVAVPFVVPQQIELKTASAKSEKTSLNGSSRVVQTKKAIDKSKESSSSDSQSKNTITTKSKIIETLVQEEKLSEASEKVFEMLNENVHPRLNIFRFYINRLAASGDLETIEKLGNCLSSDMKKQLSFDNRFCNVFIGTGKIDEYLKRLEDIIDNAKTQEEIQSAGETFPRGGAIGLLQAKPEIISRYEKIARKYASQNILGPINILWMHHFINGDSEKASHVWKEFLSSTPRLMFHRIVLIAREKNDSLLLEKLISLLQTNATISEGAVGNVYSALIDIHSAKNDVPALSDTLKKAVDVVCLENINITALTRAKKTMEKAGKSFPYKIPEKKTKKQDSSSSSSSSSSSDDEVTRKA